MRFSLSNGFNAGAHKIYSLCAASDALTLLWLGCYCDPINKRNFEITSAHQLNCLGNFAQEVSTELLFLIEEIIRRFMATRELFHMGHVGLN